MIRLTDGEFIYAVNHPDVQTYYKKNPTVKYGEDVDNLLKMMPEITKITLAGSKIQIRQSIKFTPPPLDSSFRNNNSGKTRNRSQNIK